MSILLLCVKNSSKIASKSMEVNISSIQNSIAQGVTYFSESLKIFWPSKFGMLGGKDAPYWNMFSENNILLHISRAFAENNFYVWAEIPFAKRLEGSKSDRVLDFLAYNAESDTSVMIELKNNIDTPQQVFNDIVRLVHLSEEGLCWDVDRNNGICIGKAENKVYRIVTVLNYDVFDEWWEMEYSEVVDNATKYMPKGKKAPLYPTIGKILENNAISRVNFTRQ